MEYTPCTYPLGYYSPYYHHLFDAGKGYDIPGSWKENMPTKNERYLLPGIGMHFTGDLVLSFNVVCPLENNTQLAVITFSAADQLTDPVAFLEALRIVTTFFENTDQQFGMDELFELGQTVVTRKILPGSNIARHISESDLMAVESSVDLDSLHQLLTRAGDLDIHFGRRAMEKYWDYGVLAEGQLPLYQRVCGLRTSVERTELRQNALVYVARMKTYGDLFEVEEMTNMVMDLLSPSCNVLSLFSPIDAIPATALLLLCRKRRDELISPQLKSCPNCLERLKRDDVLLHSIAKGIAYWLGSQNKWGEQESNVFSENIFNTLPVFGGTIYR